MRITCLAPFALAPKATTHARVLPIARALAARGHEVTVLIPPYDHPADAGRCWTDRGVHVENLPLPPRPPGLAAALWQAAVFPALGLALARGALRRQPDVVHVFKPIGPSGLALALLAAVRARASQRPALVLDCDDWEGRGGWVENERWPAWLAAALDAQERCSLRLCDAVTAASRVLADRAQHVLDAGRVAYVPNGLDPGDYEPWEAAATPEAARAVRARLGLDDRPLVLLYTRFFEFGADKPARVLRRLVRSIPDAHLLVVGGGKYHQERRVAAIARLAGVERQMLFAGWLSPADLPPYLAAAPVALVPVDDSLANRAKCSAKLLELMWLRRAVVAEAVGEHGSALIHGESGWLAPPGDVDALAAGLATLLTNEPLARRLGEAARTRIAADYNWPRLAATAEQLYASAVNGLSNSLAAKLSPRRRPPTDH